MEILSEVNIEENKIRRRWLPLYLGELSCGLFGISEDYVDGYLSLDEKFLKNSNSTFFVRASGDSMSPEIKEKDILIVDRSIEPTHNSIVAVFFNGNPICKRIVFRYPKKILTSFNSKYKPIEVSDEDDLQIFGVVIGLARDLI
jgi:DNA polymerase V